MNRAESARRGGDWVGNYPLALREVATMISNMKPLCLLAALTCAAINFGGHLCAQDGLPMVLEPRISTDGNSIGINQEAYDSVVSMDGNRIFGSWDDQIFRIRIQYDTQAVRWGQQVGQSTFTPSIWLIGPLAGGESYTAGIFTLPVERRFAKQYNFYGGWKYPIFSWMELDIGGNSVFYEQSIAGPGIPAVGGITRSTDLYLGATARVLLEPSLYAIYNFEMQQITIQGGINYSVPVGSYFELDPLSLDLEGRVAWLDAENWLGGDRRAGGQKWKNSYWYGSLKADLVYRFEEGLTLNAGIRFAANTDGTGISGPAAVQLGPDRMVWFACGASYEF